MSNHITKTSQTFIEMNDQVFSNLSQVWDGDFHTTSTLFQISKQMTQKWKEYTGASNNHIFFSMVWSLFFLGLLLEMWQSVTVSRNDSFLWWIESKIIYARCINVRTTFQRYLFISLHIYIKDVRFIRQLNHTIKLQKINDNFSRWPFPWINMYETHHPQKFTSRMSKWPNSTYHKINPAMSNVFLILFSVWSIESFR